MKTLFITLFVFLSVLPEAARAQELTMNWTHIYKESDKELIITEFYARADSVLLRYECSPEKIDYLELRSRPLIKGFVADTTFISCPDKVKITAQTLDSTWVDYVPQNMLRRLTKEENPDWFIQ